MKKKPTYEELEQRIRVMEKALSDSERMHKENTSPRRKADEELLSSKQKLALHSQQTPLAVIEWNLDFTVRSWNPAAEKIFGYTEKEILGQDASILLVEEDSRHVDRVWEQLLKKKGGERSTNKNITKNGDVVFCEWFNTPIIDKTGNTIAVFSLAQDITEKQMLQAETMRTKHLASLGELAAGVAHEINNPVAGIISLAEVLKDKFFELGGEKKIPEMIIREGERISKIVKNLLSFAKGSSDDQKPVLLNEILTLSIELMERQILQDGIHLSVDLPRERLEIKACSHELQQVFINILSNARHAINTKYPDPDKNKILEIHGKMVDIRNTKFVRLIFSDKGTGIPESILDKITDPFFSTKPHGQGTGLGLSISHGIIENHGGRLWFESREAEYTKVMVDLPIVPDRKP